MSLKTARLKYNPHLVEYVSNNMDWTPKKKYVEKMCDFIENRGVLHTYTNENLISYFKTLKTTFKLFDRYSKNFEKKDIMQYKTFDEFIDSIENYINEFTPLKVRKMSKVEGKLNPGVFLGQFGDYDLIKIESFQDASAYSGFCPWCITKSKNTYTQYTSNERQFFFLIKKEYEKYKNIPGDNSPFDDYGLSMLAIRIFKDGYVEVTTRWNHLYSFDKKKVDNIDFVVNLVGDKEIKQFLFSKLEEDEQNFKEIVKIVKLRLKVGVEYKDIFNSLYKPHNGYCIVGLNDKENLLNINTDEFITEEWYDEVYQHYDINNQFLLKVKLNKKVNLLSSDGKILLEQWYSDINRMKNYFIINDSNKLYNSVDFNGNFLNEKWFTSYDKPESNSIAFLRIKYGTQIEYLNENGILMIRK